MNMHDLMTTKRQREIVIEFEKVQLIRKRAKTTLQRCEGCNAESDFVGLREAAELFGITVGDLTKFVVSNAVHFRDEEYGTAICIASLLAAMQTRNRLPGTKLIGREQSDSN